MEESLPGLRSNGRRSCQGLSAQLCPWPLLLLWEMRIAATLDPLQCQQAGRGLYPVLLWQQELEASIYLRTRDLYIGHHFSTHLWHPLRFDWRNRQASVQGALKIKDECYTSIVTHYRSIVMQITSIVTHYRSIVTQIRSIVMHYRSIVMQITSIVTHYTVKTADLRYLVGRGPAQVPGLPWSMRWSQVLTMLGSVIMK